MRVHGNPAPGSSTTSRTRNSPSLRASGYPARDIVPRTVEAIPIDWVGAPGSVERLDGVSEVTMMATATVVVDDLTGRALPRTSVDHGCAGRCMMKKT
jgi:hypothetical protein